MIHQPLGGAQGQAADIEIQAKEILFIKSLLNKYMADYTDQPIDKVSASTLYPLWQHTSTYTLFLRVGKDCCCDGAVGRKHKCILKYLLAATGQQSWYA
eukprot:5442-Heterococcus_DN1.PRE.3